MVRKFKLALWLLLGTVAGSACSPQPSTTNEMSGTATAANGMTTPSGAAGSAPPMGSATMDASVPMAGSGNPTSDAAMPAPTDAQASAGGGTCGSDKLALNPFGCGFAFGTNDPGGSLAAFDYLQFMSKWIGYEIAQDGTLPRCDGCSWLSGNVAPTKLVPVYYGYIIGYLGHANGFADGNQDPNAPNLTTDGAELIRKNRAAIVASYASYAKQSQQVWPDKPLVWLLEGDFVQYSGESQKNPLSSDELAQLAADITCAIKSNMPNAVVAINQSTWNADEVTDRFWGALASAHANYDLVWTTGVANNAGFFEVSANSSSYNQKTARYAYVHQLTGRTIFVDTSFGISAMGDTWSSADGATLNQRIADGVIAANVAMPPASYAASVAALKASLQQTCTK